MTESTVESRSTFDDIVRNTENAPLDSELSRGGVAEVRVVKVASVIAVGTHHATGLRGAVVASEDGARWFVPESPKEARGVMNRLSIEPGTRIRIVCRRVVFTRIVTTATYESPLGQEHDPDEDIPAELLFEDGDANGKEPK